MKNVLRYIVTYLLLLSMVTSFAFAADNTSVSSADAAIKMFQNINVLGSDFESSECLTRAEFVDFFLKAMNVPTASQKELPYDDVITDNPYYGSIAAAYELNLISDAQSFYPSNNVTVEQAAKIIMTFLGYDFLAEEKGGYPSGYLAMAQRKDITEDVDYQIGEYVTGDVAATMILNAYNCKTMVMVNNGTFTESDYIYMNDYLRIYRDRGILTADGYVDLNGQALISGIVKIDNIKYKLGNADVSGMLGKMVTFYYKQDYSEEIGTLIGISEDSSNNVTEISASEIVTATTSEITYYKDTNSSKNKKIELSTDVQIVYNFESKFAYTVDELIPQVGNLEIISNDDDDVADVVIVKDYEVGVAEAANLSTNQIVLKFGKPSIDLDDYESYSIYKGTEEIALEKISEWDVINYIEYGKNINVYVSGKFASGIVTGISDDSGVQAYMIDGEEYYKSDKYIDASGTIELGKSGVFCLDINGNVVCVNYSTTQKSNYVVLFKMVKTGPMSDTYLFKLFTTNNEFVIVETAERVELNGTMYSAEAVKNILEASSLYELIVIETNTDGKLKAVKTAADMTGDPAYRGFDDNNFTLDKSVASLRYTDKAWGAGCYLYDSLLIQIPVDRTNTELYSATTISNMYARVDQTLENMKMYDLDAFNRPAVVVMEDYDINFPVGVDHVDLLDEWFVVTDSYVTLDSEGTERIKICGYFEQEGYKEYWAEPTAHNITNMIKPDETDPTKRANTGRPNDRTKWGFVGHTVEELKPGDVLQPGFNAKKEITCYRMMWSSELMGTDISYGADGTYGGTDRVYVKPGDYYEISEAHNMTIADPHLESMCYTAYGEVVEVKDRNFRYKTNHLTSDESGVPIQTNVERVGTSLGTVFILDKGRISTVTKGAYSDIYVGDKVFVHLRGGQCLYMMIIRD